MTNTNKKSRFAQVNGHHSKGPSSVVSGMFDFAKLGAVLIQEPLVKKSNRTSRRMPMDYGIRTKLLLETAFCEESILTISVSHKLKTKYIATIRASIVKGDFLTSGYVATIGLQT